MATQTQRKELAAPPVSPPAAVPAIIPVAPSPVSLGTLQAATPGALVTGAAELAGELANIIQRQNLAVALQGRQYVKCEGWTTLGVMLGCVAREVATTEQDGIYTATVEMIRMVDGACISRASAECGAPDEKDRYGNPLWSSRPRYARRSMAQTRATAKACRLAFSWIMALAGYQPTPAEEMDTEAEPAPTQPAPPARISASQHKLLEAQIRDYGLDRERVKAWTGKAWGVTHLPNLTPDQFERLLLKLDAWATAEYAKAEAAAREQAEQIPDDCPF
jgi:hypothetical protein